MTSSSIFVSNSLSKCTITCIFAMLIYFTY
jgi:hypothetical protein